MPASMKLRQLGHLQLFSRVVAVMAEIEVSPQQGMANPQEIKVFAVERPGFPEDFVSLLLCVEYNRRHSYLLESADCLGSVTVVGTGGDTVLEVRVLLS